MDNKKGYSENDLNKALPSSTEEIKEKISVFEDNELRKIFYDVAIYHRKKYEKSNDKSELVYAIKIMLLGWNWRAYAGEDITNKDFGNQIKDFIESNKYLLEYLENSGETLEDLCFQDELNSETLETHIENCFESLLDKKAIGSTGASKALHMFYPEVFMMWDREIISAYHNDKEEDHWRKHRFGRSECYVKFLKETKDFIKKNLSIDKLEKDNPVKIMDEYNFAKYKLVDVDS